MDILKIVVLNNSGNVGKSLICDRLLQPRIPNSSIVKIETINADDSEDEKLSAKDISEVQNQIDMTDVCIIDVGASNIEIFRNSLSKMSDTIEDIDVFIIPTVPKAKQLADTVNTVLSLELLGVPFDKIKIIFNMYDPDFSLERQYRLLFDDDSLLSLSLDKPENQFIIPNTEVFDIALEANLDYKKIINDDNDYRALIRATQDKEKRKELSVRRTIKSLFKGFNSELDTCFNKLAKSCNWHFDKD